LVDLDRKISEFTDEPLEVQFLFQRISVLVQRFNSVLFHETFPVEDDPESPTRSHFSCFYSLFLIPVLPQPSWLVFFDGQQPDGCSLIPWCSGVIVIMILITHKSMFSQM